MCQILIGAGEKNMSQKVDGKLGEKVANFDRVATEGFQ